MRSASIFFVRRSAPLALALGIAAALMAFSSSAGAAEPDKIGPWIKARRAIKERVAAMPEARRSRAAQAWDIREDLFDADLLFLYVDKRLSPEEIRGLRSEGVEINPRVYVPAVPGRHPHGFHVAKAPASRLDAIRRDARFVRTASAERAYRPLNDSTAAAMGVDEVFAGSGGVGPFDGTGVRVAVLDSGLDLAHSDFPALVEGFDLTDGDGPPGDPDTQTPWDADVASAISAHGTHVAGTVLGRGTYSGGQYKGMAPGAELCFYKIGGDVTSNATTADMVEGIDRAASQGCRVLNMSYGGLAGYLDGSEAAEQAIDAAFEQGMLCCISAGNSQGTLRVHDETVAPASASPMFTMLASNQSGSEAYTGFIFFQIVWRDGVPDDLNAELTLANVGEGETFGGFGGESSVRGTEAAIYLLGANIPAGGSKVYEFAIGNAAAEGAPVRVFVGAEPEDGASVSFSNPTRDTLVGSPAVADQAVAVAATVHRTSWVNYQGGTFGTSQPLGELATFSSHGPRIDGAPKPNVAAPGSMTISALNSLVPRSAGSLISDDGSVNGEGPVHYTTSQGTSMASPACAGVAALLFQANPGATPGQVRDALLSTAALGDAPDSMAGHGLVNAPAAVQFIQSLPAAGPQGWVVRGE